MGRVLPALLVNYSRLIRRSLEARGRGDKDILRGMKEATELFSVLPGTKSSLRIDENFTAVRAPFDAVVPDFDSIKQGMGGSEDRENLPFTTVRCCTPLLAGPCIHRADYNRNVNFLCTRYWGTRDKGSVPAIKEVSRGVISKIVHCHLWDIVRYRDYVETNNFSKNFIVSRFVFPLNLA